MINRVGKSPSQYSISGHLLQCVDTTKHLGMTSNLKNASQIVRTAYNTPGNIKFTLHEALEKVKLLAYTSSCCPKLEYANVIWDPTDNTSINVLQLVQTRAVRFIKSIKGRRGITEGRPSLLRQTLQERRQTTELHY